MSTEIKNPHDALFKHCWSIKEVAKGMLIKTLPPSLLAIMDMDSIEPCSEMLVDADLKSHIVDVVYRVNFNNLPGYIIHLIEAQSTVDYFLALRLLIYILKLMDKHQRQTGSKILPVVYVTVLYNGKHRYFGPTDIFKLFGNNEELARQILFKPFPLLDLSQISDNEIESWLEASIPAFVLKHGRSMDPIIDNPQNYRCIGFIP